MKLSYFELALIEFALEKAINKHDAFHSKVDAGEMPGYCEETLRMGKEHNQARKALLERVSKEKMDSRCL